MILCRNPLIALAVAALLLIVAAAAPGQDEEPKPPDRPRPGLRTESHPDRRGPRGPGRVGPLTEEQVERYFKFLSEHRPHLAEGLRKLRREDPEKFRKAMARFGPRLRMMEGMHRRDPKGFRLLSDEQGRQGRLYELAGRLRAASGEQATKIRRELRHALEAHFDARLKVREHELAQLQKRITEIRADLATQREHREELLAGHMERLQEMKWPPKGGEKAGLREGGAD
ncbi:MAG: hypothetical protein OER86_01590 [Phycisphaerae bacterium]|nr:hypothetical protein [Phycisphaerae bacterium]